MFIERVNLLLKQTGTKKGDFLSDLNLSKNSFHNWSARDNIPDGDTLVKIAKYFNVSVDYLLGNDIPDLTDKKKELLELIKQLSDEQIDGLLKLFKN